MGGALVAGGRLGTSVQAANSKHAKSDPANIRQGPAAADVGPDVASVTAASRYIDPVLDPSQNLLLDTLLEDVLRMKPIGNRLPSSAAKRSILTFGADIVLLVRRQVEPPITAWTF